MALTAMMEAAVEERVVLDHQLRGADQQGAQLCLVAGVAAAAQAAVAPLSWKQAQKGADAEEWRLTCQQELDVPVVIERAAELVPKQRGERAVASRFPPHREAGMARQCARRGW